MPKRKIVKIDVNRCTGCEKCVSPCAEGAIQLVGGKAKVIRDELCDGAGFCLGVCPTGAMTIEERDAETFSERAVEQNLEHRKEKGETQEIELRCENCGNSEFDAPLFATRTKGSSRWYCAKCLPSLIHG